MSYNGWTNYATWCYNLWMSNNQGSDEHMLEIAREIREREGPVYLYELADAYKADFEQLREELDILQEASVFSDLLGSVIDDINWTEIARHYQADLDDAEPLAEEDEDDDDKIEED